MQVQRDVMAVLGAAQMDGNALRLVGQLDRKLYERTNKVLEAAGGKWDRKAKAHLFVGLAEERIEQILLTGEIAQPKDEFNYFPTPGALAEDLLDTLGITPGERGLEPSAGRGAIALAAARRGARMDCYELMPENYRALREHEALASVLHGDFLSVEPIRQYDFCAMNPPFMRQADIRHVTHAMRFLRHGGRLAAIMSAGVLYRDNSLAVAFRDLITRSGGRIDELPEGSFKASGTMVRTVLVSARALG